MLHVPETRRYRKTATILAEQMPRGETRQIQTLEGPATGTGPDWAVRANTERGESWIIPDDLFTSAHGYDQTGEMVEGLTVFRKKPTADVLSYVIDTDDHEPVEMYGMHEPFHPPHGYRIVTQLDGSNKRAVEPIGFATDFEATED
jgi:hypothetical protein